LFANGIFLNNSSPIHHDSIQENRVVDKRDERDLLQNPQNGLPSLLYVLDDHQLSEDYAICAMNKTLDKLYKLINTNSLSICNKTKI
jgi:hypothetical protein